jgi:hypothetical protein
MEGGVERSVQSRPAWHTPGAHWLSFSALLMMCLLEWSSVARAQLSVDFETYPGGAATTIGDVVGTDAYTDLGISLLVGAAGGASSIVDGTSYGMSGHALMSTTSSGNPDYQYVELTQARDALTLKVAATIEGEYELDVIRGATFDTVTLGPVTLGPTATIIVIPETEVYGVYIGDDLQGLGSHIVIDDILEDQCPLDSAKTSPGSCGCGVPETDSDSDGTPNCIDGCINDAGKIAPGTCGCGMPDIDTDTDGTLDCNDLCPNNAGKITPGTCGCAMLDTDSDSDGTPNCNDLCPNDPAKLAAGSCGCGMPETDSDSDGTPDCNDLCPNDPAKLAAGS